jgi:predicted metal-dependent hydrolase
MNRLYEHDHEKYLEGIAFFNDCEFFEAHEAWEDLWKDYQGPARNFYKGLIHAAVCLHHFGNGNIRGARKLYHSCLGYLNEFRPLHAGLDLDKFLSELEICCASFAQSTEEYPSAEIVPDLIPEIHLQDAAGNEAH